MYEPDTVSVSDHDFPWIGVFAGGSRGTLNATGHRAGTTVGLNPNPVNPLPGASTMTISNTAAAAAGLYPVLVTGYAPTSTHDVTVDLNLFTSTPGTPSLVAPADGATNQTERPTFDWVPAADGESYHLQVAADAGFSTLVIDQAGIIDSEFTATSDLTTNTRCWWRVESNNACGLGPWSAIWSFTTVAAPGDCGIGTEPLVRFFDNLESGAPGWAQGAGGNGNTWALSTARSYSGASSYYAVDPSTTSDQRLDSPVVVLPGGSNPLTLQFWNWQLMEDKTSGCWDGGEVEISTDGGSTWTPLPDAVMLTDPYDGPTTGLGELRVRSL
jgi:hypothetical protein